MDEQKTDQSTSLELQVSGLTLGTLTTNAKAILEAVKVKLEGYKPENYTEDNIQVAKNDKADLNAAAKKLNDERIRLEKEFMKPFDDFKAVVTETTDLIKTASSKIDSVVKTVEEREKAEKKTKIVEFFNSTGFKVVTFERIFKVEWLNKSMTMKKIEAEINSIIEKINSDLVILDKIGEPDAKAYYLTVLNLDRAIAEADKIKANRKRLEEIEQEKARNQRQEAEVSEIPDDNKKPAPETFAKAGGTIVTSAQSIPQPASPQVITVVLKLTATREKHLELKAFLEANGITFEKVG